MADKKYLIKVERRTVDVFRVYGRNGMEAYAKLYKILSEFEDGDDDVVVQVSHEIVKQEVKQPKVENGDDGTLPGLG